MHESTTIKSISDITGWMEQKFPGRSTLFFRGQGADHPLLPSVARLKPKGDDLNLLATEQKLIRAFQRRSLPFLEMRPETPWDWLTVAQHHGLPTRLLDWTVNAMSAVWFAVEQPGKDPKGYGVVWVFEAKEGLFESGGDYVSTTQSSNDPDRPFSLPRTCILVPRYISKRIVAQGGYFTVQTSSPDPPHFQRLDEEAAFKDRLMKLVIPAESFPTIRHQLTRMGTNAMTMYPDLVGLCQDIKWRYSWVADEVRGQQAEIG